MVSDLEQRLQSDLATHAVEYGLVAARLFGSQAKGTATDRSDVDIAVMVARPLDLERRMDLSDALSSALGRQVDIVDLERSSPILMNQVLRDGVLVLDRDHVRRLLFECTVPSRYRDLRRFRRRSERALSEALFHG
jgi:predicted nucleotidyltransferase